MPILDKNNIDQVNRYNAFVRSSPYRSMMQDISWKDVKSGWGDVQVYFEKNNEIVAAVSLLTRKIPGGFSMLYAPRGPVCDFNDLSLVEGLIKEVDQVAKKHKAFLLKMDPEVTYTDELDKKYRDAGFRVKNKMAHKEELIQPRYNMIVGFDDCDTETIMSKFSSKYRNIIKSATKKGVFTTWSRSDEYLKRFFEIYETMATRNKITMRNYDYFVKMRDSFDNLRVYIACHEEDDLAGAITINYHGKLYYLYAGSTNVKRNMNPNHLMNYDMIKWGIEEGGTQYDLGGVFELNENDGLFLFKKGFCHQDGVTEYIGEVDKVYNSFLYMLYEKVIPKVQKLKKKLFKR